MFKIRTFNMTTYTDPEDQTTVTMISSNLRINGMPFQGEGFYRDYYTLFRGKGVILTCDQGGYYGMYKSLFSFFKSYRVLIHGCLSAGEYTGKHIEAAIESSYVQYGTFICATPKTQIETWSKSFKKSFTELTDHPIVGKMPEHFEILFSDAEKPSADTNILMGQSCEDYVRSYDLVVYTPEELILPSPESGQKYIDLITNIWVHVEKLILGGFFIIVLPTDYSGTDVLLSAISATANVERALVYNGCLVYKNNKDTKDSCPRELLCWIFRYEPLNAAIIETRKQKANKRIYRYPPKIQNAIKECISDTEILESKDILVSKCNKPVMNFKITPTQTLSDLFRLSLSVQSQEIINNISQYQPSYLKIIENVKKYNADKGIQQHLVTEMLYDLAISSYRYLEKL